MEILHDVDMSAYTSFKAGGRAAEMVMPQTVDELVEALNMCLDEKKKFLLLGRGTNILIKDSGYSGLIVKPSENLEMIEVSGEKMKCGCGAYMKNVAREALNNELSGFEFASGIPGSIGGALFMNAGAYGGEMKDIVVSAEAFSLEQRKIITVPLEDMALSYRHSVFQETADVITSVTIELRPGKKEYISAMMRELMEKRNAKQPVQYPCAGSFFKRPKGYFAGKLIEEAGLKGCTVGGAQVSELHAGFIINKGGATATDIIDLMHEVQKGVMTKFGVRLEPEVRIIGD